MQTFLLIAIFLPLLGAALLWVVQPLGRDAVRYTALAVALLTLIAALYVCVGFPPNGEVPVEGYAGTSEAWLAPAIGSVDVKFAVGLDGLGVWMFGLSAVLMITAILVSWEAIKEREALFYAMLLLLEFGCLGVFSARDLLLFYIFFEFTLIPLFFLIGIWGSEDRRYAAIKFFLFTLAGSMLTFLGLLAIVVWDYQQQGDGVLRFGIADLVAGLRAHPLPPTWQLAIFVALFAGFAIKVPLFPLHSWLPLAHVQAPTAGSVILAGILLKIGVYGFLRFSIPMLPDATVFCVPYLLWLSVAGIIYGALVALAQADIKKLIAYSSVSHLGICMLGLFALTPQGVQGSVLQMVNHGVSTGALFALVGMVYERYHTRQIADLSGLALRTPWIGFFMVFFTFSSIGVPGLNGFPGEFLVLLGMFQRAYAQAPLVMQAQWMIISVLSVSSVVLGGWYMLYLVKRVFFGPLKEPAEAAHHHIEDMNWREIAALAPLAVLALWIGLAPQHFLRPMAPAIDQAYEQAAARVGQPYQAAEPRAAVPSKSNSAEALARVR
ncbi:NADH-quinone oxidoreductase subunit M [Anatilimnocola aggregata]|uniref:NADH-quinone oxidoreductase subunit M n=1 Tax=Anatilimnocola aggregata TaxID=2528021 RepID=A0A517YA29_9BACT|nr:NADH-quinone oxidoreductase subunit M [Anatilimnocola aggregata]QDU27103.1 NADH-quinone oxidoreductase subunit M [Anatilimnocola aggregata]